MINFTVVDLTRALLTLPVWAFVFGLQGYALGDATNFLRFRERGIFRQSALASIFSLSLLPCWYGITAMVGKLAGVVAVPLALIVVVFMVPKRPRRVRMPWRHIKMQAEASRYHIFAILLWFILCFAMLLDVQSGDRLFLSMATYDQSNLVAFTDAIVRSGVPPVNPTYFPGHALSVFYHYYWVLYAAVISVLTGLTSNTRPVILSGIAWTGAVFLICVSLAGRYFSKKGASSKLAPLCAVALLLVSNLYVLIVVPLCNYLQRQFCCMDWWTKDQMASFLELMMWCPHHISGLIAGIAGTVLLLEAGACGAKGKRILLACGAGACLASQLGLSAYIAVGVGITWVIWMVVSWLQARKQDAVCTLIGCGAAAAISIPFLLQAVTSSGHQSLGAIHLGIRRFEVIFVIFPQLLAAPNFLKDLIYFLVVPINYLFGWGFIMVGGALYWWQRRGQPIERKHLFLALLLAVGFMLGTFVRSSDYSNDFGWRTLLLANLALFIWTVQFLAERIVFAGRLKLSPLCWAFVVVGITSTLYSLSLDRTAMVQLYDPKQILGFRQVYERLNRSLISQAIVQHNPAVHRTLVPDIFALLYSHRQAVCSEDMHGILTGDNLAEYDRTAQEVESLFNGISPADALDICRRNKIDVVIVRNSDPIWNDSHAWVTHFPLVASNSFARAYLIRAQALAAR